MNEQDQDWNETLQRRLEGLPEAVEPDRDLWPAIRSGMAGDSGSASDGRWPATAWMPRAAAALALVAVSSLSTWAVMDWRYSRQDHQSAVSLAGPVIPAQLSGGDNLGHRYLEARSRLVADFDNQLARLHPDTREAVLKNLADIQTALQEINAALMMDPNNILLQRLLVATYQDELKMLDQVNRLASSLPKRKDI